MKISIVTPSFNQGEYLAETIESVLGQEGDFSLDYIIVDGGSRDNSVAVIQHYEKLLAENAWELRCRGISYRWVSEADQGQADAIMKGFRASEGDVWAWLNSDDTYLERTLEKVSTFFRAHEDASVVYGGAKYVDEVGAVVGEYPTMQFDGRVLPVFNFICQPSVFARRAAIEAVGGVDRTLQYVMDYDLWIRLSKKSIFYHLEDSLATYRLHEDSKTVSRMSSLANAKEALDTVVKHYNWAPLNRVYVFCREYISNAYPGLNRPLAALPAVPMTLFTYLSLNRCVRRADLALLNKTMLQKFLRGIVGARDGSTCP